MSRLDVTLVSRGLAPARSRAQDWIKRGLVTVDGAVSTKCGLEVPAHAHVVVAGHASHYVSRGAEKLVAALDAFGFSPSGRPAVDIGASTGGFTEVLLERGALLVTAVDVGHGQLHPALRDEPRVTMREGTDARQLTRKDFGEAPSAVVADVSFISLEKALPAILQIASPDAWLVALIKPQFEVGPALVGRRGIVRDAAAREAAVARITAWIKTQGWAVVGVIPSPITGGDGNHEYLLGARNTSGGA